MTQVYNTAQDDTRWQSGRHKITQCRTTQDDRYNCLIFVWQNTKQAAPKWNTYLSFCKRIIMLTEINGLFYERTVWNNL